MIKRNHRKLVQVKKDILLREGREKYQERVGRPKKSLSDSDNDYDNVPEKGYCKYCYKKTKWFVDADVVRCEECDSGVALTEHFLSDSDKKLNVEKHNTRKVMAKELGWSTYLHPR